MKNRKNIVWLLLIMIVTVIHTSCASAKAISEHREDEQSILVGRVSHVEGHLLRYDPEEEEWVAIHKDEPFGVDETIRSGENSKAEFIIPNNTLLRVNGDTRIKIIVLKEDVTGIDMVSGLVRFYNKGSDGVIKVTSPYGQVTAPAGTGFDLKVGDDYVEVSAFKGTVSFLHFVDDSEYEVISDSSSLIVNSRHATSGEGQPDFAWVSWNHERDKLLLKWANLRGESADYLPPTLHHEAYILEKYGRWSRVYWEGGYNYFWRPIYVGIGWAPFTVGRWSVRFGHPCWIPREPFGYTTHHYGNWVSIGGLWYWAPPVARVRVRVGPPLLNIRFAWHPGRVAWMQSGIHIGWVPLAPREHYYGHRRWGRHSVAAKNVKLKKINIKNYRNLNHSVIIDRKNLYRVKSYRKHRIKNIKRTKPLNKYRATTFIPRKVRGENKIKRSGHHSRAFHSKRDPNPVVSKGVRQKQLVEHRHLSKDEKKKREKATKDRRNNLKKRNSKKYPSSRDRLSLANRAEKGERKSKLKKRGIEKKTVSVRGGRAVERSTPPKRVRKNRPKSAIIKMRQMKSHVRADGSRHGSQRRGESNIARQNEAKLKNQLKERDQNRRRREDFSEPETRKVNERERLQVRGNLYHKEKRFNGRSRQFRPEQRGQWLRHRNGETRLRMGRTHRIR